MSTPGVGSGSTNNPLTNLFNPASSNPGSGREDYFYPMRGINPFSPPDMKTLVYSPEVRILIARGHKQYDVSRDVVRGTIHRRENSASSLFFTLANSGDYNGLFQRMDRVVVFLKRIRWQQVFSGYLDTVPYAQLYGGPAEYKATCTIKRLMHTWWSPDLPQSLAILDQTLFAQGGDADSGLGQLMRNLMVRVGGWAPEDIHVQNFPRAFFEFLKSQINVNRAANQAQSDKLKQLLLGPNYNQSAPGAYAGWSNNAGPAGPIGAGEAFYIAQIVAACDSLGLGPVVQDLTNSQQIAQAAAIGAESNDNKTRTAMTQIGQTAANWNQATTYTDAAVLGVACAMAETGGGVTIRNLANASVPDSLRFANDGTGQDHDSIGIFQQRGNGAWGTVSQRMDPRQAATMFFNALPPDWRNMDPGLAISMTQGNATGTTPYSSAYPLAKEKVAAYRAAMRGAQTTMAATPLGSAASAIGDTVGVNPIQTVNAATTTPATPEAIAGLAGKPNPDSEGAVQTALQFMSVPYKYGGKSPNAGLDCCLAPQTMVYGPDGAKPIEELQTGDRVYSYKDNALIVSRVKAQWRSADQEVFKIKMRNRSVTASANHPFLRLGWEPRLGGTPTERPIEISWARLDELQVGDFLVVPKTMEQKGGLDKAFLPGGEEVDEDVAWLIGLILGDGHIVDKAVKCAVYGDTAERAEKIFHRIGAPGAKICKDQQGVVACSVTLSKSLTQMGLRRRSYDKRIPESVWSWSQDLQRAFLDGYCDADGHRPHNKTKHGERTYSSSSRLLLEEVRALHIILGDSVSNITTTHRKRPIVIKGKTVKEARPIHTFAIWEGEGCRGKYASYRRRKAGFAEWIDSGDFTVIRVLEITPQGMSPTYDIEVEENHNFVADGIVVHNSGLMTWSYRAIGKNIGESTSGISASVPRIDPSQVGRGDLIITNGGGHVGMYYEPGFWIETGGPDGVPGGIRPLPDPSTWVSVHRVCQNGGPNPAAFRISPYTAGPGTPAGTGDQYTFGTGGGQVDEPIARNLFAWSFTPDRFATDVAGLFIADHKEFINSEPLIQMVQAIARSGLRNFASAPDGSFMAYYPDYFGLDGKKAVVQLEDIELKNVKIDYSDDNLTTHVYVAGDHHLMGADPSVQDWLDTAGSVTVEHEWLYRRLTRIAPGDLSGANAEELMRRFGVRPLKMPIAVAGQKELEFLLACQLFMEKWAEQYRTTVDFTFLPELFPGMRVILSGHDLQVYVTSVTHTFDFENGFYTQADIMAPSRPDAASLMVGQGGIIGADDTNIFAGLGFNPDGTTSTQVMP